MMRVVTLVSCDQRAACRGWHRLSLKIACSDKKQEVGLENSRFRPKARRERVTEVGMARPNHPYLPPGICISVLYLVAAERVSPVRRRQSARTPVGAGFMLDVWRYQCNVKNAHTFVGHDLSKKIA